MNKAKPHNTIFDRVVNQLSSAAHQAAHPGAPNSSSSASSAPAVPDQADASRLDRLMKFSGLSNIVDKGSSSKGGDGDHIRPELMYENGDGELSIETAEKMLEWHAEAVGRMVELSPASDVCVQRPSFYYAPTSVADALWFTLRRPKNAFTLLKVLADSFGKAYLETALDTFVLIRTSRSRQARAIR